MSWWRIERKEYNVIDKDKKLFEQNFSACDNVVSVVSIFVTFILLHNNLSLLIAVFIAVRHTFSDRTTFYLSSVDDYGQETY